MIGDPRRVVVVPDSCNICGIDEVEVYHQNFPELRIAACPPARRLSISPSG